MSFSLEFIMSNLDNPNIKNFVQNSPELQKTIIEKRQQALESLKVAHPEGDASKGTVVPIDKALTGDIDQGSALDLLLSYAEPRVAAGAAIFGLGLAALPLIAAAHHVDDGLEVEKVGVKEAGGFMYSSCKRTREDEDWDKPLTQDELEDRLGPLDPASLATEILRTEGEANRKERCTDDEIGRVQKCIVNARVAVRRLRRRSALAFMGLKPGASGDDVQQRYKRLALEMHPDKGGDAERFQQLQEMKERLTKSIQEEEDEELKKQAEKEEEEKKLPESVKSKQLRKEAHVEAVKLWDLAREAEAEMFTDKGMLKADPAPVLQRLRSFVESYSNAKIRMLPHGDRDSAKDCLWQFKSDGLEIIAVCALLDPAATASLLQSHINYKIVARSGSKEVAREAQDMLNAVADVQRRAEAFLVEMGRARAEALDEEDQEKAEEEADGGPLAPGDEVIIGEDHEDAGKRAFVLGPLQGGIAVRLGTGRRLTVQRKQLQRAPPADPPTGRVEERAEEKVFEQPVATKGPTLISKAPELPADPVRKDWDTSFSHPYVGAMDGDGKSIFCRACRRWLPTRAYAHEPFLRHCRAAHPTPPLGWKGPVPSDEE